MEVLHMVTQSNLEGERYEARLKYWRDENARLHDAILVGELIGRVQLFQRLLKQEPTPREALQGMQIEQLQQLADRLEAQLAPRG